MIDAEVCLRVYSDVTGRVGNWSYRTRMTLAAVPPAGAELVWGEKGHEVCDQVRRVYFREASLQDSQTPLIGIDLEPRKTDSPDILNELMELHQDWEQLGGPWAGQEEERK